MFYFDDVIQKYEKDLNYSSIIEYLEGLYFSKNEVTYLTTLVAYAWYFSVDGNINQNLKNYDQEFLFSKWKYYFELGAKKYIDDPEFCYVAGYIHYLHGCYIYGIDTEDEGRNLVQRCLKLSKNESLRALADNFIEKRPTKKVQRDGKCKKICNELFPSDSILDRYFRTIKSNKLV